jgi:hypothetical protein
MDFSDSESEAQHETMDLDLPSSKIDNVVHGLVMLDVPSWYMNPTFKILFQARADYDSVAGASPLTMAPGLDDALAAASPPNMAFFRSLPGDTEGLYWGIYALVMEKEGCRPCLYIGSAGTKALSLTQQRETCHPPSQASGCTLRSSPLRTQASNLFLFLNNTELITPVSHQC